MIRRIAFTLLFLLLPVTSFALGLGKLDLKSKLNEPFEAHIELLSATANELDSLKVNLAGAEEFQRAGVERSFNLTKLKFDVKETSQGADYIRVYSEDPIQEPFLNFLVEINWSRGRLLREYTALLDPPTYAPIPHSVTAPSAQTDSGKPISKPIPVVSNNRGAETRYGGGTPIPVVPTGDVPTNYNYEGGRDTAYSSPSTVTGTSTYTGGDYSTSRGDTLWSIASQMRPDRSVSIQQMMLALYRANPEAFVDGNINRLKTGQVLSNPALSEVQSLSKSEAITQVQQHNDLWQGLKQSIAEQAAIRPDSAGDSLPAEDSSMADSSAADDMSSEPMAEESDPELQLVGSEDSSSGVGQGAGDAGSDSATMDKDLALAEESLVALESENKELKEKLVEAESLIDDLNRLIVLKEDELSALKQQLGSGTDTAGMQAEPADEQLEPMADMPEQDLFDEETAEEELPSEELPGEELMEEPQDVPMQESGDSIFDDTTKFIQEEELPEIDPEQYGELYDEQPEMAEEFPGESGLVEEQPELDEFAEDPMEEPMEEFDDQQMMEEPVGEPTDTPFTEPGSESDSGLGAVSNIVSTAKQYLGPLLEFVKQNLTMLGAAFGGLLVVLLGYLGFKKARSGKDDAEELDDDNDLFDFDDSDTSPTEVDLAGPDAADNDTLAMDAPIDLAAISDVPESDIEKTAAHDFTDSQPPGFAEPKSLDDEDEDPLAEVNVFLAYEHFEQAQEFVRKELEAQPDNLDYHAKLLEVFYAAGDKKSYEEAAKVLHDKVGGSGQHWDMALAMWSEMSPNRKMFSDRPDGLDDTQAFTSQAVDDALSSGIVDLTVNEPATENTSSDLLETSTDVLDITGQNDRLGESNPAADQSLIDTLGDADNIDTLTDANILDVANAGVEDSQLLNLDAADPANITDTSMPFESTEHILDLTGGDEQEDILDITAGSQEDLLDVTGSTDLDSLAPMTSDSDIDIDEESTLDFDVEGLNLDLPDDENIDAEGDQVELNTIERAMDTIESSNELIAHPEDSGNVVDLGLPDDSDDASDTSLDLDISGAFDLSGGTEQAENLMSEAVTMEVDTDDLSSVNEKTVQMMSTEVPASEATEDFSIEFPTSDGSETEIGETPVSLDADGEVNTLDFNIPDDTEPAEQLKNDLADGFGDDGSMLDLTDDFNIGKDDSFASTSDTILDLTNEFTVGSEDSDASSAVPDLELQDDDEEPSPIPDIDMEGTVEMPQGTIDAPTVEMPKVDYVDDEDEKTVFIPRSDSSEQQSLEDEVSTKLDLAKAYVELGDHDSAKTILDEIVVEGNAEQKQVAEQLLSEIQ